VANTFLRRFFAPAIARGRGLARDERGVTAIEFGLLGLPFFAIILAVLETSMMFLGTQILDGAVEEASRKVRTGEANAYSPTQFRALICGYTFGLFGSGCPDIKLKVEVISSFSSVVVNPPVQTCVVTPTPGCTWTVTESYTPGASRDVVQVSAYYRWPLMIVFPYFNLRNQPDNYRLISAIRVFRNEPF
jgi:Flp pilus assembly protein TadG